MKHLSNQNTKKLLWIALIVLLVIKLVWFSVELIFLPVSTINYSENKSAKNLFYRVKLSPNKASLPKKKTTKKVKNTPSGNIKSIKLIAIYNADDAVVVAVVKKGKTIVLAKGELIDGFKLVSAGNLYAEFVKGEKSYKIELTLTSNLKNIVKNVPSVKKVESKSTNKKTEIVGDVVDAGDLKIIDKSLIDHYSKNMNDIYKDIGIKEVKNGKEMQGFKISFIRRGSNFAKLGLRRGDIIKTMNGQKLDSYNAAFGIYKNISNIDNLSLIIQRDKEEMELEYEVN